MKKHLSTLLIKVGILLGCLIALFGIVFTSGPAFAASTPTRVKIAASTPGPDRACFPQTSGSGWKTSASGGYVGPQLYDFDPTCDGSYSYVSTPTHNSASWVLSGNSDSDTAAFWAYLPTNHTGATKAVYTITTLGQTYQFTVNQQKVSGWYQIGTIGGTDSTVTVTLTAAPHSQGNLLADAVAFF